MMIRSKEFQFSRNSMVWPPLGPTLHCIELRKNYSTFNICKAIIIAETLRINQTLLLKLC